MYGESTSNDPYELQRNPGGYSGDTFSQKSAAEFDSRNSETQGDGDERTKPCLSSGFRVQRDCTRLIKKNSKNSGTIKTAQ